MKRYQVLIVGVVVGMLSYGQIQMHDRFRQKAGQNNDSISSPFVLFFSQPHQKVETVRNLFKRQSFDSKKLKHSV